MVTKLPTPEVPPTTGSVLAKIHMVTKPRSFVSISLCCSVLAKIHMVTKRVLIDFSNFFSSVLAKIHMVTKLERE